jgi:hypothetical protein
MKNGRRPLVLPASASFGGGRMILFVAAEVVLDSSFLCEGLPRESRHGLLPHMSTVSIEVEISHGKVTPVGSCLLPESGRALLTMLPVAGDERMLAFSIGTGADGLPVIHAQGRVITSALVREIEGFAG